jgi:hypothetical protein
VAREIQVHVVDVATAPMRPTITRSTTLSGTEAFFALDTGTLDIRGLRYRFSYAEARRVAAFAEETGR